MPVPGAKRKKLAGAAIAVATAVTPQAASAANIVVTTPDDNVTDDGLCTLREAITNANDDAVTYDDCAGGANPDTITFTTAGPIVLGGTSIPITDPLVIDGPDGSPVTIDADALSRIFTIDDGTPALIDVTLRDLTLTNGDTALESFPGGGAVSSFENLTLDRVTVSSSVTGSSGGGVRIEGLYGTTPLLTVTDSTLTGNDAYCCGGAISTSDADASISGSTISGNYAYFGGGVSVYKGQTASVTDTSITGNTAYHGAGLYVYVLYSGPLTVEDSTITGNTAYGDGGGIKARYITGNLQITNTNISNNDAAYSGGLYIEYADNVVLDTITVTGNTAVVGPGGVHLRLTDTATLEDSQITGNQSADAGGMLVYATNDLDIVNTTIASNTASNYGGGLLVDFSAVDIDLATIAANSANEGGNIWVADSDLTIENSIVADGTAPTGPDIHMASAGANVTADWSLIETPVSGAGTYTPTNVTAGPPLLGPLANNGGPTQTMLPQPGSPAISGGDPAFTPPPSTDQRKLTRPVGRVDMGAVEVQHGTVSIAPLAPVAENAGSMLVTLNRTGGAEGSITINFSTVGGTATANVDFATTAGSVNFLDGELQKTFSVTIIDDANAEPNEQFTVQISAANPDFVGTPASQIATITDNDITADLTMTKIVNGSGPFLPGSQVTFTIGVTNNGPANATNVVITDMIPSGTNFVSATPSQGGPCTGTTTITCNLGTLNNGVSASVTLVVQITGRGQITNTATGASDLADPSGATASASFNALVGDDVPALSDLMLMALAAALAAAAAMKLRM